MIRPIDALIDLATYRHADRIAGGKPDPLLILNAYAQATDIYRDGKIITATPTEYEACSKETPNDLVNKFGQVYASGTPLLLHQKLADVIIDTAIDMRDRYRQFTVVMDGLRTYDSGVVMQQTRPDLVASGMLAKAGTSAHNRALAVDSKLFQLADPAACKGGNVTLSMLVEADEKGHLDDLDMTTSNRFYTGEMSDTARTNRLQRIQAWQRASVKNRLPIANLLSEFWDDRVPGSPADMWRVVSCRALCIGVDGNPKTNPAIAQLRTDLESLSTEQLAPQAHQKLTEAWNKIFTPAQQQQLDAALGQGGGSPPPLADFIFHEWLETIHDKDLIAAGYASQAVKPPPN
jgi:hypothetical protein